MLTADEAADLIEAIAARQDRAAFAALFRHFAPRLKAFVMRGGTDADTFFFAAGDTGTTAKTEDTVVDFSTKDKDILNLHAIDANSNKAGNQDFSFIKDDAFSRTAGELRFEHVKADTFVYGDVNGDGKADFTIHLDGSIALKEGFFDL